MHIYITITCVFICIFNPYFIIRKLKGHLCARSSMHKKTNYHIYNKGRINTLQSGVLDFNPPLSFSTLSFFLSLHSTSGLQFVFFTLSRRSSGLLSLTTRIPQQRPKVFIVISRATHSPPLSRDPSSALCGKTLDVVSWISQKVVEWRSPRVRSMPETGGGYFGFLATRVVSSQ